MHGRAPSRGRPSRKTACPSATAARPLPLRLIAATDITPTQAAKLSAAGHLLAAPLLLPRRYASFAARRTSTNAGRKHAAHFWIVLGTAGRSASSGSRSRSARARGAPRRAAAADRARVHGERRLPRACAPWRRRASHSPRAKTRLLLARPSAAPSGVLAALSRDRVQAETSLWIVRRGRRCSGSSSA